MDRSGHRIWQELAAAALVAEGRRAGPGFTDSGKLGMMLREVSSRSPDPDHALLVSAAIVAAYRRAGQDRSLIHSHARALPRR